MKIIFLEAVHNFGGSSKSTTELAKRLIEEGNDVLIVDFWGACKPFVEACVSRSIPLKIIDKRERPILLINKSKAKIVYNYIVYFTKVIKYKKLIKSIISEFKPDLVSVNGTKTLSVLSKSNQYKIAFFARGWFLPNSFGFLDQKLLKKLVDVFLVVSQSTRQMVFAGGYAKLSDIYVIHNAISLKNIENYDRLQHNLKYWYLEENRNEFVMMHCGSFIKTKGQHIAVETLKMLKEKKLNVKLLLVGMVSQGHQSKQYHEYILNKIQEYKLNEDVTIILNESNVLEYYTKTDILVHPSYSEGLPRVVLEAMAFGKPVIGNAVGGMTDFIANNYTGFLTNFNAVEEYVEIIEKLIYNKDLYKFISKNSIELIKSNYAPINQINEFNKIKTRIL